MIKPAHILIVDNDKIYQSVVEGVLLCENYKIQIVSYGEEAVKLIKNGSQFDLVILDIMMRDERDGVDTLIAIKTLNPLIKVIMLTVLDDLDLAVELINIGAYYYFVKERLDIHKFRNIVAECLQIKRRDSLKTNKDLLCDPLVEKLYSPIAINFENYQLV